MLDDLRPSDYDTDPNSRYRDPVNLGTWSSTSDVDKFLNKYNHDNGYRSATNPLRLGDYVIIQDGTYNVQWVIAGFDMENNQTASDGTVYDNGYGICMVPQVQLTSGKWNTSNTTGGYKSSYMHTTVLPDIVSKLQTIFGSHIVNRNVLLSSNVSGNNSNAYAWTTAYATLMSIGQMNGTFAANNTKYDDGEANYKLPIFDHEEFKIGSNFWVRNVRSSNYVGSGNTYAWFVNTSGNFDAKLVSESVGVRPLIYIR